MIFKILKNQYFWLIVIILLGFWVRRYKIDNPVADWHSWRQADTAAVARNFFQEGFNPLVPKYDDMSGVAENPIPNPQRYRFVEFPIYNSLVYFLYLLNGGVDERLARLVSILMSLGSTTFLFFIVRKYWGEFTALVSAFVFALLPFNIYFSRVILPEPTLVFFSLGMFYFTDLWIWENSRRLYFISLLFAVAAFLIKPVAIFYLLPLIYSYYQKEKRFWPIPKRYYLWIIPALLPFIGWRVWISQHPEGIPASNWLFNGNNIRFKPAFWKWIIGDRFGREILSVTGTVLFFIGLLKKDSKNLLLHLLAVSSFLYLIVFATGNVQHDYYQTLIIPALSVFLARGLVVLIQGIPGFVPRIWTIPLAVLFFLLTFYLSWNEVKGFYQINNGSIVVAGKEADRILPKNAVVIAPYNGDTAFLYQINRHGWAYVALPTDELIKKFGVTHYVSVNYDDKTNWVIKKYTVLEKEPGFVIVDLTRLNPSFDKLNDIEPN
jgi:4-amino-4-deoxy-L-arabinose transferase-like glycosyltransferase